MGEKTNFPRRITPNNLCRYLPPPPRRWSTHPSLLKCGLCTVTSFQSIRHGKAVGRGWGEYFTVEKPDKHYLSQMIKVNINREVMLIVCTFDMV